ncbi:cytochrome c biogenesis protein ResB [Microcella flavibacter]|uniref:cytochrome c biogenesis protein ResB n=1 Tax=Microcella flavibacter TaxID=1804990 RepID=UPI0014577817|nr:cytochrome c biogenesis protein ResB [Microcella flavibacter]
MEPLRPSDHHDSVVEPAAPAGIAQPKLGVAGWIRFAWRQLTSMRTALVLLLLLAVAAIPGSLVPQRGADPNGVIQYEQRNPELFPVLDALQLFDTYTSPWFSAIYLLLFVSLIGCIIPRTIHHARALRSRPPKTPARLNRLVGYVEYSAEHSTVEAELARAEALLKKGRYRVERYGDSLSAERGYLRETGNLVFHMALIGVLATVGFAGGFQYNGAKILVEDQTFVNVRGDWDTLKPGRFFDDRQLEPFTVRLDSFDAEWQLDQETGIVQPLDFTASVTTTEGGVEAERQIRVNEPIAIGGTNVYLLGHGFAPVVTVRDPAGVEVFSEPIPFLPQDSNLTSLGVVKVPTGLDEQLGMLGFFYPSALTLDSGALTSAYPEPDRPVLTFNAFVGDLGLDDGVSRNAYSLSTDGLEQITGGDTGRDSLVLGLGESAQLPNGLGTVEFTALPRFVSVEIHHDPTQAGVLISSILIVAGLLVSLFVPRRRLWVVAEQEGDDVRLQYAGLARGDDPNIEQAVDEFARAHRGEAADAGRDTAADADRDHSGAITAR